MASTTLCSPETALDHNVSLDKNSVLKRQCNLTPKCNFLKGLNHQWLAFFRKKNKILQWVIIFALNLNTVVFNKLEKHFDETHLSNRKCLLKKIF